MGLIKKFHRYHERNSIHGKPDYNNNNNKNNNTIGKQLIHDHRRSSSPPAIRLHQNRNNYRQTAEKELSSFSSSSNSATTSSSSSILERFVSSTVQRTKAAAASPNTAEKEKRSLTHRNNDNFIIGSAQSSSKIANKRNNRIRAVIAGEEGEDYDYNEDYDVEKGNVLVVSGGNENISIDNEIIIAKKSNNNNNSSIRNENDFDQGIEEVVSEQHETQVLPFLATSNSINENTNHNHQNIHNENSREEEQHGSRSQTGVIIERYSDKADYQRRLSAHQVQDTYDITVDNSNNDPLKDSIDLHNSGESNKQKKEVVNNEQHYHHHHHYHHYHGGSQASHPYRASYRPQPQQQQHSQSYMEFKLSELINPDRNRTFADNLYAQFQSNSNKINLFYLPKQQPGATLPPNTVPLNDNSKLADYFKMSRGGGGNASSLGANVSATFANSDLYNTNQVLNEFYLSAAMRPS
jgi:hypothetical protein